MGVGLAALHCTAHKTPRWSADSFRCSWTLHANAVGEKKLGWKGVCFPKTQTRAFCYDILLILFCCFLFLLFFSSFRKNFSRPPPKKKNTRMQHHSSTPLYLP